MYAEHATCSHAALRSCLHPPQLQRRTTARKDRAAQLQVGVCGTCLGVYMRSMVSVAEGSASSSSLAGTRWRHQKSAIACTGTTHTHTCHLQHDPVAAPAHTQAHCGASCQDPSTRMQPAV